MEKLENMLDSLSESISQCIKDFSECKNLDQKKTQAEIIKILCDSMGVFFNAMKNTSPFPFDNIYEDDYIDYDDDEDEDDEDAEEYELEKRRKIKNSKKSNKDKIPF